MHNSAEHPAETGFIPEEPLFVSVMGSLDTLEAQIKSATMEPRHLHYEVASMKRELGEMEEKKAMSLGKILAARRRLAEVEALIPIEVDVPPTTH